MTGDGSRGRAGPEAYDAAISRMHAFLGSASCIRPLAAKRPEFEDLLDALIKTRKNLEGSLVVTMLGGTGVGKSTLINAVAAAEIACTSPIRPCTTEATFYSHRGNDLGPIASAITDRDRIVLGDSKGLAGKIILDPPDFDSMVLSNRRRLLELLKVTDMAVCVVDREKYRNLSLFRMLRRFREGRKFLFVLNKSDFGIPREVRDDLDRALAEAGFASPAVFEMSARAAFEARTSGGDAAGAGDFAAFEKVILDETDRAAIRRIKDSNIAALVSNAYSTIKAALPEGIEEGLSGIPGRAAHAAREAASGFAAEIERAVFEADDRMRLFVLSAPSMAIGGLFGVYLSSAEKIGSLFKGRLTARKALDPAELKAEVRAALGRVDRSRIDLLAGRARSDVLSLLESAGVDSACWKAGAAWLDGAAVSAALSEAGNLVMERMGSFVEESASGFWRSMAYNVLPALYVAYFAVVAVQKIAAGDLPDVSFFLSFLVLLGVVCFLQHVLAERGFRRRGRRFMKRLGESVGLLLWARIESAVVPSIGEFASMLGKDIRAFRETPNLITRTSRY